ncbi:MAG TPA: hypothetical protein V6C96_04730, partial [Vampirovibrionales bacterium]
IKLPVRFILDIIASLKFMIFDSFADGFNVIKAHFHFIIDLPKNYRKRQMISERIVGGAAPPIYKGSIVYQYFVRGVRKYQDLINNTK